MQSVGSGVRRPPVPPSARSRMVSTSIPRRGVTCKLVAHPRMLRPLSESARECRGKEAAKGVSSPRRRSPSLLIVRSTESGKSCILSSVLCRSFGVCISKASAAYYACQQTKCGLPSYEEGFQCHRFTFSPTYNGPGRWTLGIYERMVCIGGN